MAAFLPWYFYDLFACRLLESGALAPFPGVKSSFEPRKAPGTRSLMGFLSVLAGTDRLGCVAGFAVKKDTGQVCRQPASGTFEK